MMGIHEIRVLLPDIIIAVTAVSIMMVIAFYRNHGLTVALSVAGLALAAASLIVLSPELPEQATSLLILDRYSYFYTGLVLAATAAVCILSYGYLEKYDITEEKVRLAKHLQYFEQSLHSDDSNGKKLGFICQEIGREINTIGSKANDAPMQRVVVQMKDELEKIKEQILNVL